MIGTHQAHLCASVGVSDCICIFLVVGGADRAALWCSKLASIMAGGGLRGHSCTARQCGELYERTGTDNGTRVLFAEGEAGTAR